MGDTSLQLCTIKSIEMPWNRGRAEATKSFVYHVSLLYFVRQELNYNWNYGTTVVVLIHERNGCKLIDPSICYLSHSFHVLFAPNWKLV